MPRTIEPQIGPAVPETHQTLVEEPWAEDPTIRDALEESNGGGVSSSPRLEQQG